jgi:UDP-3-O-[3-hydroxymyristoyl] N-acetylglucosamine deacetylase
MMSLPALMTTENFKTILVVDDDASIRKSLQGVLLDEGYLVTEASNGLDALSLIETATPDAVLLDIWMPGLDGLETLEKIKKSYPDLPVIMISGHATIATAVKATRMGANDFIEKPVDLEAVLLVLEKAVKRIPSSLQDDKLKNNSILHEEIDSELTQVSSETKTHITPIVFTKKALLGDSIQQKTLSKAAILYGLGLHSGKKSGLVLEPLPANSGIHFVGVSEKTIVPAHVAYVESTGWATTLKLGDTQVATIEHLMSALHAYGISNLLIKCNGEVPVFDGSAKEFCNVIEGTGIETQLEASQSDWREIVIREPIKFQKEKGEYIELVPADTFSIDYTLKYPAPLNTQEFSFTLSDSETYKNEIAPARTFGFVKDISYLQKQGLALGGRFDNFCLIADSGPINTNFRFDNEPVRHKILDAIGDLYLLGRKIRGKVNAMMTGHSDNIEILRLVLQKMDDELSSRK